MRTIHFHRPNDGNCIFMDISDAAALALSMAGKFSGGADGNKAQEFSLRSDPWRRTDVRLLLSGIHDAMLEKRQAGLAAAVETETAAAEDLLEQTADDEPTITFGDREIPASEFSVLIEEDGVQTDLTEGFTPAMRKELHTSILEMRPGGADIREMAKRIALDAEAAGARSATLPVERDLLDVSTTADPEAMKQPEQPSWDERHRNQPAAEFRYVDVVAFVLSKDIPGFDRLAIGKILEWLLDVKLEADVGQWISDHKDCSLYLDSLFRINETYRGWHIDKIAEAIEGRTAVLYRGSVTRTNDHRNDEMAAKVEIGLLMKMLFGRGRL